MIDVDKMYSAIAHAETGSFQNPYIRTTAKNTPGGSTAFGPVQITDTLAKNYVNKLSPESQQFYTQVMAPRYQAMKQSGNNKGASDYNPEFDYGGTAQFTPEQYSQQYEQFSKELMSHVAQQSGGNENKFIQLWRGKPESQDPAYFQRVQEGKKLFDNEIRKLQLAQ